MLDSESIKKTVFSYETALSLFGSIVRTYSLERASGYQPLYYRTNEKTLPPDPADSTVVTTDELDKWTTVKTTKKTDYTYVSYRYRNVETESHSYTSVSLEAATIISNGRIVTNLIDVDSLFAQEITVGKTKNSGIIKSCGWNGSLDGSKITTYGSQGWAIDYSGQADFVGMHATKAVVSGTLILDVKTSIPDESKLVQGEMFLYRYSKS